MADHDRWLIVSLDGDDEHFTSAIPLGQGELVVGSDASCGLILPGRLVASRHVCIVRAGDTITFEDLSHAAGTYHNGVRSDDGVLALGDTLTIGTMALRVDMQLPRVRQITTSFRNLLGDDPAVQKSSANMVNWQPFRTFLDKLRSSSDPQEILESLLVGLINLLDAERGLVLLRSKSEGKMVPVATYSLTDPEKFTTFSRNVCIQAVREKKMLSFPNTAALWECDRYASLIKLERPRAVLCCPLQAHGTAFGVIYLDMPPVKEFEPADVKVFTTVTGLAAELVAAHHARSQLFSTKQQLEALTRLAETHDDTFILGTSPVARRMEDTLKTAASQDITVTITGETGTGKEMVARALHRMSSRSNGPFIPVHCAAISPDIIEAELFGVEKGAFTGADARRPGRFELANKGTLFLDEIGELSLDTQVKLLRVLQERTIMRVGGTTPVPLDFRLVCATNADLERAVKKGTFRQDFYYRVNVFPIHLQPLRKRVEDILPLAKHFVALSSKRFRRTIEGFTEDAEELLRDYAWPGNVRELRNVIERAVVVEAGDMIGVDSLPGLAPELDLVQLSGTSTVSSLDVVAAAGGGGGDHGDANVDGSGMSSQDVARGIGELVQGFPDLYDDAKLLFERAFIKRCYERNQGNVTAMARETGLARPSIYRRIEWLEEGSEGENG